jgi:hypothetical protein
MAAAAELLVTVRIRFRVRGNQHGEGANKRRGNVHDVAARGWQGQGGPSRRGEQGSKAEQRVSECKSRVCSLCTLIQIVANAHHQEGSERQRKVRAMREMSEGEGGNADVVAGFVVCSVRTHVHSCLQYGSKSSESETLPRGAGFKRAHSGTWGMRQGSADACGARQ